MGPDRDCMAQLLTRPSTRGQSEFHPDFTRVGVGHIITSPALQKTFENMFLWIYLCKMAGDLGEFSVVSVSHEAKHETSLKIGGTFGAFARKVRNEKRIRELLFCNSSDLTPYS